MKPSTIIIAVLAICCIWPHAVIADGIDLVAYFSRTPYENVLIAIPVVLLIMLANYGLNFLVIGLPAKRLGSIALRRISLSLIWLTILGQVADRIGALLAGVLADPVVDLLGLSGEGAWAIPLLGLSFIFSALSIALLAFSFAKYKWNLSMKHSLCISAAAGILTNPAWAMGLWTLG